MWHSWERRESVQGLGGKTGRKGPLGRPRSRWNQNGYQGHWLGGAE
jgi:hypothetical protein